MILIRNKAMRIIQIHVLFLMGFFLPAWANIDSASHIVMQDALGMPKKAVIKVDNGSIVIQGVDAQFSCAYTLSNTNPEAVKVKKNGDTLEVTFKKIKNKNNLENQKVDFILALPKNCTVKISLGGGLIDVQNIDGEIKVEAGSADVKIADITHDISCKVGSGNCFFSYKERSALARKKKCELKGASINAIIEAPSDFCIKNVLRLLPFAATLVNDFLPCPKKNTDLLIKGGISSGSLNIRKK